ncbi:MAG: methyltransferase domain-containing protein [Planctomycetes bacterium]|nr:methyltransferase domain-containing protein [Planctomycetota bacterium]MBM4082084.1 methyltransferase domain-containing protein [Planctomycetota bacterium]
MGAKKPMWRVYDFYASWYDYVFGLALRHGQRKAIRMLKFRPDERVLEVGVGTGISLPFYPKHSAVVGIDICGKMLKKAEQRRQKLRLANVTLWEMDACKMGFPDHTFDKVIAAHVISVVPDPARALLEMKRVCKKGGDIVLVNHFQATKGIGARMEKAVTPLCERLGWRMDLNLEKLLHTVDLKPDFCRKANPLDSWLIVKCTNNGTRPRIVGGHT